jgi:hypothetical protein
MMTRNRPPKVDRKTKTKNGSVHFEDWMEQLPERNRRGKSTKNRNINDQTRLRPWSII